MARRTVRSRTRELLIPLAGVAIISYFAWHGLHGAYGFWAAQQLDIEEQALSAELERLTAERQRLERQVALIRAESLDPDMLEERARALLNLAHQNDVVIQRDPNPAAAD